MLRSRPLVLFCVVLLTGALAAWQLPTILQALPSRYLARLPQPIQEMGMPEHVEVLPTAALPTPSSGQTEPPSTATRPPAVVVASPTLAAANPTATATPTPTNTPTPTPIPFPPAARVEPFIHQFQTWNNCGPATLAMSLSHFGLRLRQEQTAAILKPNPEDRNVSPQEMAAYVNDQTEVEAIARANGDLDTLRRLLAHGFPVIVELGIDPPGDYAWMGWYGHYLLVVAYDDAPEQVWAYDSWFGTSEVIGENANTLGRTLSYADLDHYWQQFNRNYVALYPREQASQVATLIGPAIDDTLMWEGALAVAQAEMPADPGNPYTWFNLGTDLNALGRYQEAAEAYDTARAIGLPWRMLWYQFGPYEAYYQVGRYEDVILLADVTLDYRPYFEESFYYRGLAKLALGDSEGGRADLEAAVAFNPHFVAAVDALNQLTGAG